ncbi:MAG TPA: diguanylate cyclase [Bacilli bacterium]
MTNFKSNILLVDDRPENLLVLEAILSGGDFNLIKAHSGEEALNQVLKKEFALILLDVQMPGIDGFETAKILKSREKSRSIPIIFVTAISKEQEHVRAGYLAGAVDYMYKPIEPETLKTKVDAFVKIFEETKDLESEAEVLKDSKRELEILNSELLRATSELRRAEALARIVGETSMDTIIIFDTDTVMKTINPAVKKMFGYYEYELLNQRLSVLFPFFDFAEYENRKFQYTRKGLWGTANKLYETVAKHKDGMSFPVEIQVGESYLNNQWIFACTVRDISEQKEQMAALEHQAMHDPLTGLPNRNLLNSQMQSAFIKGDKEGESFALFMIDLDQFKQINDTLGHHIGDAVLKRIGPILRKVLRPTDIVVRLGGDEFAVLLPNIQWEHAVRKANQILKQIKQPLKLRGSTLLIGASLGIAMFPEHGKDMDTLMRHADTAMYEAKRRHNYEILE